MHSGLYDRSWVIVYDVKKAQVHKCILEQGSRRRSRVMTNSPAYDVLTTDQGDMAERLRVVTNMDLY
jgi:hypothetical protein